MPFVTKLDYSDNRQIKQFEHTNTQLSGTTEFGVPFSALTGVLDSSVILTSTLTGITSTFSGNTTITNITFGDQRMVSGSGTLEVITDITSGATQQGLGFDGIDPYEIDGNTLYGSYTGSSYDFSVTSIEEVGVDQWTGETISNLVTILSGASDDFTGRTIWVDVLGITKTRRLILDDIPDVYSGATHVLTRGLSGDVANYPLSTLVGAGNTDDYTIGATLSGETLEFTRLSGGTYSVELDSFENSGLERINEGNGDGWRLIDRDPEFYGNIGQTAIDFSLSTVSGSTTMGSTGFGAVTFGLNNINPYVETLMIGRYIEGLPTNNFSGSNIIASENFDGSPTKFYNNIYNSIFNVFTSTIGTNGAALGTSVIYESTASGRYLNMYAGQSSAMFGARLSGGSTCTTIVGLSNIDLTTSIANANSSSFNTFGPRFIVGVGSGNGSVRANGFVVMSDGTASFPSLSVAEIDAATGDSAVTKEWVQSNSSGFTSTDDYLTGHTFNTSTGLFESTLQSGSTVSVNLDGRYSQTGHTHDFSGDYLPISGGTMTGIIANFESTGIDDTASTGTTIVVADDKVGIGITGATPNATLEVLGPNVRIGESSTSYVVLDYDGAKSRYTTYGSYPVFRNLVTVNHGINIAEFSSSANYVNIGSRDGVGYLTYKNILGNNGISFDSSGNVGIDSSVINQKLTIGGTMDLLEQAAANTDTDNYGQIWVKNDTPNTLWFTNDIGTDSQLGLDITGMTVTGTTTKTISLFKNDGNLIQANFTDEVGVGAGNDYLTGATFNTSTGDLTMTLFSGSTVVANLDNRYSLTGHTHSEFGDHLPLSGGTLTGGVTGTTFNIDKSQLDYQENLSVTSATTEVIATVSILEHKAVFFDYVVSESTNIRAGTVMSTFMGGTTVFTDNSTTDIGDTSGVIFSTDISGSDLRLLADTTTDGWEIKVMIRAL